MGWGALSCVVATGDQAPRSSQPPGLTAALCRPHRKDAARGVRGWGKVTQMHRQHFQGGRQEMGKRVQGRAGHMGRWRWMSMEARAPFLEALAPPLVVGQWRHTPHPQSLMWPQFPPLPTSPAVPICNPHPHPVLHSCGGCHLLSPEGQAGRTRTWVELTDRLVTRLF